MWWGSGPDPGNSGGEGSKEQPQNQQLQDLQEQFEQQQTFIAQLKEMLRKTEQSSSVSREKVEEYASTLNEINARAKLSKIKRSEGRKNDPAASSSTSSSTLASTSKKSAVVTPAKEKINLLRQQLEENRIKLAERDKNQKDMEVMVNQIKAKLDESQATINDPPIPKPESEIVATTFSSESSKDDMLFAIKSKDEHIIELTAKVQQLQANVLDLQENVKEKDSVIDARTKAITLLSENLSKKGKDTLDMLDETKEQMRNMQQNFVILEANLKEENTKLHSELVIKENRIQELTEINNTLNNMNSEYQERLSTLNNNYTESENKIIELNKLNEDFQNRIREFEASRTSPEKVEQKESASPQRTSKRKGSKKSKAKETVEPTPQIPESSNLDRISELEKLVEELQTKLEESKSTESHVTDSDEISKLNKQLEEMNKNMIKMKAQHKAKLKEFQKKSTPSELNEKVTNLESENVKLGHRVAELEDEKGNLQLRLVDYESNKEKEYIADLENKIEEQKMEIENHIRTITSLESQITTSSNELSALRSELANLMHIENAQVCSEMTSVQLEEQLDKEVSQKKEIQDKYNEIVRENENLLEKIETLNKEKQELSSKLDQYMQENIDLIDRLEKLSAEKVSSAESIEIVDALTQQEKLEIEAYQKNLDFTDSDKPHDENIDMEQNPDINESVSKLNEETSELMEKIKLFTVERREVMEKMDNLTAENQQLSSKLEKYEKEKSELDEKYKNLCEEKDSLVLRIDQLSSDNEELSGKLKSLPEEKSNDQSLEKVQEELVEYRAIIENQKLQIASLQEEIWNKSDNEAEKSSADNKLKELNESLNSQLRTLQTEYESLFTLHESIKEDSKELVHARNKITEFENKVAENAEEITFLQGQIESNREEIIDCVNRITNDSKQIADKDMKIEVLEQEAEELNKNIEELNIELDEKEKSKNDIVTSLSSQLSELKTIISENFEQLEQYETEINKNSQTTEELNEKLEELNYKIVENEHITQLKNVEINTLKKEKASYETKIKNLEDEVKQKNDKFAETCRQLKEKCKFLENQVEANTGSIDDIKGPFEAKIAELQTKNKGQVEKMKKIAANLKKKTNICQELETKLAEFKEKWENESKEKDEKQKMIDEQHLQLNEHQNKIQTLLNQFQEIEKELSAVKLNLDNKKTETEQIKQNYETQLQTLVSDRNILNNKLQDFDFITSERDRLRQDLEQYASLHDNMQRDIEEKNQHIQNLSMEFNMIKSEFESSNKQTMQNLVEQLESMKINHETSQNAMGAKLQEKDLYIENLEAENVKYKERVAKLEEGLSNIEDRRQHLEQKTLDLKVQLEEKSFACEEVSQSEDLLERRLSALLAHDEIIEKKLEQSTSENQTLTDKVKTLMEENESLLQKLNETTSKVQECSQNIDKIEMLENDVARLSTIISNSENEMKKLQTEYEKKIAEKNNEIENMEVELNSQLQELHAERKNLLNKCEVLQDNAKEYADNYQLLSDEMDELKEKLLKTKQHLDETILENQKYCENKELYLVKINELENRLADVQNTSGDVDTQSLRNEITRLQNIINQKDVDIQNYQKQNMQLQMASFSSSSTASLFDVPIPRSEHEEMKKMGQANTDILEQEIIELRKKISSSDNELLSAQDKVYELECKLVAAQNGLEENKIVIDNLQQELTKLQELERMYHASQNELQKKQVMVDNLQQELTKQQEMFVRKTAEEGVAEIILTAEKAVSTNTENNEPVCEEIFQKQDIAESLSALQKPDAEATKEELLRKIKALEFMLFNVEKEKDDTLVQCHEFTNELARLVYERENLIKDKPSQPDKPEPDLQTLESLIVSSSEVDNVMAQTKQLHSLEFPPLQLQVNKDYIENIIPQPVTEEIIEPKKAYLCYTGEEKDPLNPNPEEAWGWGTEDSKIKQSIESQLLQMDATKITEEDKKQFELMQYGQVTMPKVPQDHTTPVSDCVPDPKYAYICYPSETKNVVAQDTFVSEEKKNPINPTPEGWGTEDSKIKQSVESQILQMDATKITEEDKKQFELMQYGQVTMPKVPQDHTTPVSDCVPDPKHAYICYPSETKNVLAEDTFASEEDGWGWNAEEAKLEAEHRMSLSAAPIPPQVVDSRVEQLEEKIHDLEVERSRLLEEIKSSQVRSGKLIKKLKLLKEKNDTLVAEANKKSSGDFCGLEMAIQDELNSQIINMEKKIKELSEENSKEKAERENVDKKLEVITNANDRMIEMKEKQDNEIQFLQFKIRELSSKLEQLEWGDESPNRSKTPTAVTISTAGSEVDITEQKKQNDGLAKKIAELNTIINDLTLDNEEMQCMLEEQRNMRLEAEKALLSRPVPENMKSEQEFLKVETENKNLHEELTKLSVVENNFLKVENENKNLQEELVKLNEIRQVFEDRISQYVKNDDELTEKSNNMQLTIENLVQENQLLNNQYSVRIDQLQNENIELHNQLTNMNVEREAIMNNQVDPVQIAQLQNENIQLQNQLSNLNIEKEALLKSQLKAHQFEIVQLKSEITKLEEEIRRLENLLSEKEQNLQNFSIKIQQLESEKTSVETRLQEILNIQSADKTNDEKLQQMNEQLMTALANMDNKNKEIVELNEILNKERLESGQKLTLTIEQLAQQWSERVDQRGNDIAESWKLHLESVQNEFSQKEENLRAELNNLFKQNEELLSQNDTLQQQIKSLLSEKQTFVSDNNNTIESLQQSVNSKQTEISELLENVRNKETENLGLSQNLTNKETEILQLTENINSKETAVLELTQNVKNKESEILELLLKLQETSTELQLKNSEIVNLQLTFEQMQSKDIEHQNYVQQYAQQLEEKTTECTNLQEKLNELNIVSQEEDKQISDLKIMIENQVLKIEDLKKEIEHKDAEYNALVAEFYKFEESYLRPDEQQRKIIENLTAGHQAESQSSQDDSKMESAKLAELDLALYMLHQRDVRCEELTVELMQLLEERDTLQLKLSNAIRVNEELRTKVNAYSAEVEEDPVQESPKSVKSTGAIPKSKSTAIVLGATGTELATEATENITTDTTTPKETDDLADKLSQLHSVGYNRDKTLKDDQEIRHIQQMTLMQQHRDLAANLPAEAAARLVDASYTVSRDVQSPSKVLLNWLWGRSTPKVNDV